MSITTRPYTPQDFSAIGDFLIRHYQPGSRDGNWLQSAWEYMRFHPLLQSEILDKFRIWEDSGSIVAVAHCEWHLGEAFFEFHPDYRHLRQEMLAYAEANLLRESCKPGKKYLAAYVNDNDDAFLTLVGQRGYEKGEEFTRPFYQMAIPDPFPAIVLPEGFSLTSLAEECDWGKVNRVLWRGFDHEGEPPAAEKDLEERRIMFDTPTARRDLKIAVKASNGEFVAFCGMFYEPTHRVAYVEPVATDPAYRRMGLGRAAVLEGIRRCLALGGREAFVGSDQEFYKALGFAKVFNSECWVKYFDI